MSPDEQRLFALDPVKNAVVIFDLGEGNELKPIGEIKLSSTHPFYGTIDSFILAPSDNRVCLTVGSKGLVIVDASDPAHIRILGATQPYVQRLWFGNVGVPGNTNVAYLTNGQCNDLAVLDIADPTHVINRGRPKTGVFWQPMLFRGNGKRLYAWFYRATGDGGKGIAVFDITTPTNPRMIGVVRVDSPRYYVSEDEKMIFVASDDSEKNEFPDPMDNKAGGLKIYLRH